MQKVTIHLKEEFKRAIERLGYGYKFPHFEPSKDPKYGDICTNIACQISSEHKRNPFEIAQEIVKEVGEVEYFERIIPERNGFINLFYSSRVYQEHHQNILKEKENIGRQGNKKEWRFIEIVSANPTGLLHIGHARNGIFSDTISNILEYVGYSVYREYLVNDFGTQIRELIDSVWKKYRIKFFDPDADLQDHPTERYNGIEIDECVEYLLQRYKED